MAFAQRFAARIGHLCLLFAVLAVPGSGFAEPPAAQPWLEDWFPRGGRLGVKLQSMTPELRDYFRVEGDAGVLITRVTPESPADEAGLAVGDVIVRAAGEPVRHPWELARTVWSLPEGEILALRVSREGKTRDLQIPLAGGIRVPNADHWKPWLDQGVEELKKQIRELERRLDELERQQLEPDEKRT